MKKKLDCYESRSFACTQSPDSLLARCKEALSCRQNRTNKTAIATPATAAPIHIASTCGPRGCLMNRMIVRPYFAARNPITAYRRVRPASTADTNLPWGYFRAPAPTKNADVGNGGGAIHATNTATKPLCFNRLCTCRERFAPMRFSNQRSPAFADMRYVMYAPINEPRVLAAA